MIFQKRKKKADLESGAYVAPAAACFKTRTVQHSAPRVRIQVALGSEEKKYREYVPPYLPVMQLTSAKALEPDLSNFI